MIIVLIILFTAIMVGGFFYLKGLWQWLIGVLGTLLLVAAIGGLVYHDTQHWGMKQVTTSATKPIYTAGDPSAPYGLLIESEFGTSSGNYIFMYREATSSQNLTVNFFGNTKALNLTSPSSGKDVQNFINNIMSTNAVETAKKSANYQLVSGNAAELTTKTTRYQFSSGLMSWLFGVGGEAGTLVKETYTVKVPKDTWLVLTQDQVQLLSKEAPALQAQLKAQLAADPAKAAQLAHLQATDPIAYAKMQVTQLKQLLNIK